MGALAGAWLLFVGPVFQAMVELREEENAAERIDALRQVVPPQPPISLWWWLLPPVGFFLERRRHAAQRQAVVDAMTDDELAVHTSFMKKSMGWLYVALGGYLLAISETYGLHLHAWITWPVVVVLTYLAIGNAVQGARKQLR